MNLIQALPMLFSGEIESLTSFEPHSAFSTKITLWGNSISVKCYNGTHFTKQRITDDLVTEYWEPKLREGFTEDELNKRYEDYLDNGFTNGLHLLLSEAITRMETTLGGDTISIIVGESASGIKTLYEYVEKDIAGLTSMLPTREYLNSDWTYYEEEKT